METNTQEHQIQEHKPEQQAVATTPWGSPGQQPASKDKRNEGLHYSEQVPTPLLSVLPQFSTG
jgi:hypothetical protein